jgi:hypothetical protein
LGQHSATAALQPHFMHCCACGYITAALSAWLHCNSVAALALYTKATLGRGHTCTAHADSACRTRTSQCPSSCLLWQHSS